MVTEVFSAPSELLAPKDGLFKAQVKESRDPEV
jgi:hypothetical protein